jgi:RHS repeat-associated protein
MLPQFQLINMNVSFKRGQNEANFNFVERRNFGEANGRMYDPVIGRVLSPDNYVQDATNAQSYNRYSYCLNNPLKYTDPSGEFIQYIIGAIIGGVNGYMTGKAAGYDKLALFGFTMAGAAIGAGTAGIGTAVSSSMTGVAGVVISGAAAGGASVASFNTLSGIANGQSGSELVKGHFKGMAFGSISGGVGAGIGGMIGGGWGAFAGGVASNLTNQGLEALAARNSVDAGKYKFNWLSVAMSGISSVAMYHLSGGANYMKYRHSGASFEGHTLSYRQFMGMSADYQRSAFWKAEFGGVLTESGRYIHRYGTKPLLNPNGETRLHWDPVNFPEDVWATSHSHTAEPGTIIGDEITVRYHSILDSEFDVRWRQSSFVINKYDASFHSVKTGDGHSLYLYSNDYFIRNALFNWFYNF